VHQLGQDREVAGPTGDSQPQPPRASLWGICHVGGRAAGPCSYGEGGGGAVRYSSVSGHNPAVPGRQLGVEEGSALLTFGPDTSVNRTALVRINFEPSPQDTLCGRSPCIVSMLQYSAVPLLGWSTVFAVLAEMCAAAGTTPR